MNSTVAMLDSDILKLHPAMSHVPEPTASDRAALKADLEENGQLDPIDVTPDHLILDGRTRWQLLRELGSRTVLARFVDIPEADQPSYIVRRAVNRRHLTQEQKRDLIAYLASLVVELGPHGELVGMTAGEIAAAVGVSERTVRNVPELPGNSASQPKPTHVRKGVEGGGTALQPKPKPEPKPKPVKAPPPPRRMYPDWWRSAGAWLKRARKEDATALRELDERVHAAMRAAGIE